jgi:intracellular sulfur oxidation DsrE/DsrF family protein
MLPLPADQAGIAKITLCIIDVNGAGLMPPFNASNVSGLKQSGVATPPQPKGEDMNRMTNVLAALLAAASLLLGSGTAVADSHPDNVVYHVNDAVNATAALRNISNHLEVNPKAKIVVVTHAQGVDFLMEGARDKNGNPYNVQVETLAAQGVTFDVCEITLRNRKLDRKQFIPESVFVPSGVAELAKLQSRGGYAYIKP